MKKGYAPWLFIKRFDQQNDAPTKPNYFCCKYHFDVVCNIKLIFQIIPNYISNILIFTGIYNVYKYNSYNRPVRLQAKPEPFGLMYKDKYFFFGDIIFYLRNDFQQGLESARLWNKIVMSRTRGTKQRSIIFISLRFDEFFKLIIQWRWRNKLIIFS